METYVALLRGINVGGNAMLPMARLKSLCEKTGFLNVRTYIQSGNVIFESKLPEEKLAGQLERALLEHEKKKIPAIIRSGAELKTILARNPFPDANPAQVGVMLFSRPAPSGLLKGANMPGPEKVEISGREIFIHYPNGMGRSRLKLPKMQE